jgi:hypothetical protein
VPDPAFFDEYRYGSGSRVSLTNNRRKKFKAEKIDFFSSKIAIYLSLGLHKGLPSYRRSFKPSKENIQHMKLLNLFLYFCGSFLPIVPVPAH